MADTETAECPLCMESLEIDDMNFYPCSCGYQICRFCWHRIRTYENGLCPACRKAYSENPAIYRPLTQDEISRINRERKQRETQRKQKISENRKHLSNVRVIQKNLLFVVGLSQKVADAELLKRPEYFGKFGKILKMVVNPSTNYAGPQGPSASAYITFSREEETLRAILGVNNVQLYGRTIRASLGTTKYCTHYLRNTQCHKTDCMYLHEAGDESGSFTKEDMQQGKHQLYEKELLENYLKSVQNKRKSGDIEQFSQIIEEEKTTWFEEETPVSNGSALPAKAAWAEKEAKPEDLEDTSEGSQPNEYDEQAPEETLQASQESESSMALSSSLEMCRNSQSYENDEYLPHTDPSSLPKEFLEPQFATGWAQSGEMSTQYQEGIAEDPGGTRFQIPSWLDDGLGLNNLRVDADDDLGFDPFTESHKGLEDFIATNQSSYPTTGPGANDFFSRSNWHHEYASHGIPGPGMPGCMPSSEYSLFGKAVQDTSSSVFDAWRVPSGFGPSVASVPKADNPSQEQKDGIGGQGEHHGDIKSWQDGLRALLPNINISFSASLGNSEDPKAPLKAGRSDSLTKPPPGFIRTEELSEANKMLQDSSIIWSKMRLEKEKKRSPPGLGINQTAGSQLYATKVSKEAPGIDRNPPVASWNTIVGGAPATASVTKVTPQSSSPTGSSSSSTASSNGQPAKSGIIPGKTESPAVGKPLGKATTMFSISSSQQTNKPTAKVKPLKCVVPSEDFLVPNVGGPTAVMERGSGMNDLDDIDFNDPVPPVRIQQTPPPNTIEKARVIEDFQGQAGAWKKTSKRKKKKKDGNRDISTIKNESEVKTSVVSQQKPDVECKKSILERPQSKEAKERANLQGKATKTKEEKDTETNPDVLADKNAGKGEMKDALHPRTKSFDSKLPPLPSKTKLQAFLQQQPAKPSNAAQQTIRIAGQRPPNERQQSSPAPESPPKPFAPIRILKSQPQPTGSTTTATLAQSAPGRIDPNLLEMYDRESLGRLAESTKILLETVLSETEVIKSNTEQISKDIKAALDKCKEPPLTVSDIEKLNCLPLIELGEELAARQGDSSVVDTSDLEKQVESARREAELLEVRLNDVIRKNMASDMETMRKKGSETKNRSKNTPENRN